VGYSLGAALGASVDSMESSGPGSFGGPFVSSGQAVAVLVVFVAGFVGADGRGAVAARCGLVPRCTGSAVVDDGNLGGHTRFLKVR